MKRITLMFRKFAAALAVICLLVLISQPARAQLDASQTYGATSGGSANAQTLTINNVGALSDLIGVPIWFLPVATNTAAMTLQVSNTNATLTATAVSRPSASSGPIALVGGEVRIGVLAGVMYDGTRFQLISNASVVYLRTLVFTSIQTYTPSAGLAWARVTVVGGGGGGGGVATTSTTQLAAGSGGGGGGQGIRTVTAAQIGANQTVIIGAAGTATAGSAGGNGGQSSFGALCVANGGNGGTLGTANGGFLFVAGVNGGGTSSCDIGITGSGSGFGLVSSITATNTAATISPGIGGAGYMGGGIGLGTTSPSAATTYGAGGNGAAASESQSAIAGGAGFQGVVIVEEYVYN